MKLKIVLSLIFLFIIFNTVISQDVDPDSKEAKRLETLRYDSLGTMAVSTEMVYIEGGMFKGEKIEPFYMDVHLLTVEQYMAAIEAGVCPPPPI